MPIVAVGAVGAVCAALMALLLLYGAALIGQWVAHLVPSWHIPGLGNIRSAVAGAISAALRAVENALDSALSPVAHWILATPHAISQLIGEVIALGNTAFNNFNAILHWVQHLYNVLIARAVSEALKAIHEAQRLYNLARAYAATAAAAVLHEAQHLYNVSIARAVSEAAKAIGLAEHLYNLARAYAAGTSAVVLHEAQRLYNISIARAVTEGAKALAEAEAFAKATATAAVGVLVTDVTHVAAVEWVKIRDEVVALEGAIAADLPDIGAAVRAIDLDVPLDIAAVITGVLAIDIPILRFLRECGIPNCKNLGKFGHDLTDLFGIVEGAALLAFLAALIHDPDGTAHETIDVAGNIVTGTVNLFENLIGAR